MSYHATFKGWDDIELADLIIAYRKAKSDCFFESIFPSGIKFSEYERNLVKNLNKLNDKLRAEQGFIKDPSFLGSCRIIPKKLAVVPNPPCNGHTHFSNPKRAFNSFVEQNSITPEFRVVGDFPIETHIISALWINMIGHKFDACLDATAYGSRLRRVRNEMTLDKNAPKSFHITAIGSFEPYFQPYQKWRNNGLQAIRCELGKNNKVIAVSLDLKNYYHNIDPAFLCSKIFLEDIGLNVDDNLIVDNIFTNQISTLLTNWTDHASEFMNNLSEQKLEFNGGLVIGLTASRIISNILLSKWDKLIQKKITPIHYGRYIDDMFLVLQDPGTVNNTHELMEFLQERLGKKYLSQVEEDWQIMLGDEHQKNSTLILQENKQKLFILEGQAGCDLLDSIEKEIYELSSEHRLMPLPDQLDQSTAARVLSAAGNAADQADTLRRADGLTIRRLSWSLQMRHAEVLARDLSPISWKKERYEFYEFAFNHILRADKIFDHYIYLPRLLGFAINLNEWEQAEIIINSSFDAIDVLANFFSKSEIKVNGYKLSATLTFWHIVSQSLAWQFVEAVAKYYDINVLIKNKKSSRRLKTEEVVLNKLWTRLNYLDGSTFSITDSVNFYQVVPFVAACDLNKTPYKFFINNKKILQEIKFNDDEPLFKNFKEANLIDVETLKDFLLRAKVSMTKNKNLFYRPFLFPTRACSPKEIAELVPECIQTNSLSLWAKYVKALRGIWIKQSLINESEINNVSKEQYTPIIKVGSVNKKNIIIAITSLLTEEDSWESAASNKENITLERYKRIAKLVNEAIHLRPKPDYLIFPELSLPTKWISSVGNRLTSSGISLIAGTEYEHKKKKIFSRACLELIDNSLGYPSSIRIWQTKNNPAPNEDKILNQYFGKVWSTSTNWKRPIYNHNNFYFSVMICSELQNSKERIALQGEIDALMVLSWNKDLDTFSSLIESSALDLHAYLIMVNNRKYVDSRVRVPAKESFLRDIARLRGSENDFLVTVQLDINKLRAFQSRAKRWSDENDPYKPVPEGFEISKYRKKTPPK